MKIDKREAIAGAIIGLAAYGLLWIGLSVTAMTM